MKGNCKRYVDQMSHNYIHSISIFLNKNNQGRSYQLEENRKNVLHCRITSGAHVDP